MAVKYRTDYNVDGQSFGQDTSEKISFYGKTPVVQPSGTSQSAVATTAITTLVTTPATTDIATAVNSLISRVSATVTLINQLRGDLVTIGIVKGSN